MLTAFCLSTALIFFFAHLNLEICFVYNNCFLSGKQYKYCSNMNVNSPRTLTEL